MRNNLKNIGLIFFIGIVALFSCSENAERSTDIISEIDQLTSGRSTVQSLKTLDSLISSENYNGNDLGIILYKKGKLYSNLQNDELSMSKFNRALGYFEKSNNQKYIAKTKLYIGSLHVFNRNREGATENLLEALEISKSINNRKIEANVYNSLSHFYFTANDVENAINYSVNAIEIQISEKDTIGLSSTYNNLAVIYKNINNLTQAKKYNLLSLESSIKRNDYSGTAKSFNNLGRLYEMMGDNKRAFEYYKKAGGLNLKHQILNANPLRNIGALLDLNGELDSAKIYYYKALEVEKKANRVGALKIIREALLKLAYEDNEKEEAMFQQNKIDSLNSILKLAESQKKLKALENQYEFKASEKELEQKVKDNKKNRWIFIGILFLLIALGLFFYQKNKNTKLKLAKEKLILEQRVLRSQMNPHFIFNALSAIQNSMMDNDSIKSASYLSRFAKLIRQNFDFINHKTISLTEEIDALTNYMDTQKLRFHEKFDYIFNIETTINTDLINIPPLLLQPFVENSIEHGFKNKKEKGLIEISISETEEKIIYSIFDNGRGYDLTNKDTKDHAIDVFKKRMKLLEIKNEKNFNITSNNEGTKVEFNIRK